MWTPIRKRTFLAARAALSHSEWTQQKVQALRDGLAQGSNKLGGVGDNSRSQATAA